MMYVFQSDSSLTIDDLHDLDSAVAVLNFWRPAVLNRSVQTTDYLPVISVNCKTGPVLPKYSPPRLHAKLSPGPEWSCHLQRPILVHSSRSSLAILRLIMSSMRDVTCRQVLSGHAICNGLSSSMLRDLEASCRFVWKPTLA
jgi:hypothetical protein